MIQTFHFLFLKYFGIYIDRIFVTQWGKQDRVVSQ